MLVGSMLVVILVAMLVLFVILEGQDDRWARLRLALRAGVIAGGVRAIFACGGWYVSTHTEGWFRILAYFSALLALPEAAWAKSDLLYQGSSSADAGFGLYAKLGALLVASSLALSLVVALAVEGLRWGRSLANPNR